MAEYINREEFRAAMQHIYNDPTCPMHIAAEIEQIIDCAPAADVAPVVHARWIARSDKGIISMTHPYMCSRCWRVEMDKEPYCNCGAKMDGGSDNAIN